MGYASVLSKNRNDQEVTQMSQRLADAAVFGTKSALTDEKRALLDSGDIEGLLALNRSFFGTATMLAGDSDNDDHDDADDEDDDSDDEDDDEDEDDEEKGKKKPDAKDVRIKELSAENKTYRQRASQRGKRIKELEAEVETLKKGKPAKKVKDDEDESGDDSSEEITEAKKQVETLARTNEDLLIRLEFTTNTKYQWKNPKAALRLLDLSDVEVTEDGEVEGLDEAIEALAKSDPYLLAKSKDDEDDDEDDEVKKRKRSTGQATGSRKKGNPNRDALLKKYPALRR